MSPPPPPSPFAPAAAVAGTRITLVWKHRDMQWYGRKKNDRERIRRKNNPPTHTNHWVVTQKRVWHTYIMHISYIQIQTDRHALSMNTWFGYTPKATLPEKKN